MFHVVHFRTWIRGNEYRSDGYEVYRNNRRFCGRTSRAKARAIAALLNG